MALAALTVVLLPGNATRYTPSYRVSRVPAFVGNMPPHLDRGYYRISGSSRLVRILLSSERQT